MILQGLASCKTQQVENTEVAHRYVDSVRYTDSVRVYEYTNDTTHYLIEERIKYVDRYVTDTLTVSNTAEKTIVKEIIPQWVYIAIAIATGFCFIMAVIMLIKK